MVIGMNTMLIAMLAPTVRFGQSVVCMVGSKVQQAECGQVTVALSVLVREAVTLD
jgi:hypothetical protein